MSTLMPQQSMAEGRSLRRRCQVLTAVCLGLVLSACAQQPEGQTSEPDASIPAPSVTSSAEAEPSEAEEPTPSETPSPTPTRASDASWDPDSYLVLTNKHNPLEPADYVPEDLRVLNVPGVYEAPQMMRETAADALEDLFSAAADEDLTLAVSTAYRGFDHQLSLYDSRFHERGQEATEESTARPGYSEHQTGLAADLSSIENPECQLGQCFGDTPEGIWVAEHAHEFGFIVRYPDGDQAQEITGYFYEPWHLRYVGVETATEVYEADLTLEEYWEQPAAPDYEYDYTEDPHLDALR